MVALVVVSRLRGSPVVTHPGGPLVGRESLRHLFLALLGAAFGVYGVGLALLRRRAAPLGAVLVLAAAIQLAPLAAPLLISSDVWTYWAYARVDDPYRDTPADDAVAARYAGTRYLHETSAYGPAFSLLSRPVGLTTSADVAAYAFRVAAALSVLAAAVLVARRRPFAAALVGWNPLVAIHFTGGGHNDAFMLALVAAALALADHRRLRLAGGAWALGVLVKWAPLVLLPLRALEARAAGRRVDHAGFAATVVVTLGVATVLWRLHWLHAVVPLSHDADRQSHYALVHRLGLPGWGLVPAYAVAYAWLLREAARGRARLSLSLGLLLLAVPYLIAWYALWPLVLAAHEDDDTATVLSLALCAYLIPQRLV